MDEDPRLVEGHSTTGRDAEAVDTSGHVRLTQHGFIAIMNDDSDDGDRYVVENLYQIIRKMPLFDDLYLNMQAMNIGLTDLPIRDWEDSLLHLYIEKERTPVPETMTNSAFSQMWIFAVYELLRTWRQRANELIRYARALAEAQDVEKEAVKSAKRREIEKSASRTIDQGLYRLRNFERVENDPNFAARLELARTIIDPVFRSVEAVRMVLAKHEIPKSKGLYASAPGYGRIDMSNGSIYWSVIYHDNTQEIISRRSIAEAIEDISLALDQVRD